jgi:squalene synthase HpnC
MAVYGFARLADYIGDEAPGERLPLLAWLGEEIDRVCSGTPEHPVMRRLALTVRELRLSPEPFRHLVEANRRDQVVSRYDTFDSLLEYCALSAAPVGRLVLDIFGVATAERRRWSDSVCAGLQVAEHLQDVSEDLDRGRVYLPQEDLARFGCSEADLRSAPLPSPARAVIEVQVERARMLLEEGSPLVGSLRGRLRLGVAAFVAGGHAALDGVERGLSASGHAPGRPRRRDAVLHLTRVVARRVQQPHRVWAAGIGVGRS